MTYTEKIAREIVKKDMSAKTECAYKMEMWKKADQTKYDGLTDFINQITEYIYKMI